MWGGNGKNHTWSMGHYWLVALFVLSATLAHADFMSHDSENLQQIFYVLGGGASDGNSIWAIVQRQNPLLTSIDSRLSPVSTISSDVVTIKQYLDYNLNGDGATDSMSVHDFIVQFNQKFFKGVDRFDRTVVANPATVSIFSPNGISPFIEPGKTFQKNYNSQIAVTNIAETYWLEKIHGGLENIYGRLGIVCNTNFWYLLGSGSGNPFSYMTAGNWDFKTRQREFFNDLDSVMAGTLDHITFLTRWADHRMVGFDFFRSFDYNNMSSEDQVAFENGYKFYFGSAPVGAIRNFLKLFSNEGNLRQKYYSTYVLQNMSTNTFFSGLDVNNFFTNGVALSLYATNAFQRVAESSGINTNEMYLGSYGSETNSDVFADIMTNGVELLEGNQVYSSLGEDVDAGSLSNKVSMFNFTEKFDDSIKPFLDEIENASGGDWVINFGNVDIGTHFSFSIPSLTVERNETYLRYVDKFLDLLKIILGVVFFLILWRQLEQSVEST